jgi:hypothetical protein
MILFLFSLVMHKWLLVYFHYFADFALFRFFNWLLLALFCWISISFLNMLRFRFFNWFLLAFCWISISFLNFSMLDRRIYFHYFAALIYEWFSISRVDWLFTSLLHALISFLNWFLILLLMNFSMLDRIYFHYFALRWFNFVFWLTLIQCFILMLKWFRFLMILMIWPDFFIHRRAESFFFSNELWLNVLSSCILPVIWSFCAAEYKKRGIDSRSYLFDILKPYGYQEVSGCPGGSWVPPGRGVKNKKYKASFRVTTARFIPS